MTGPFPESAISQSGDSHSDDLGSFSTEYDPNSNSRVPYAETVPLNGIQQLLNFVTNMVGAFGKKIVVACLGKADPLFLYTIGRGSGK